MCKRLADELVQKRTIWGRRYRDAGPTKVLKYITLTKEYLINNIGIADICKCEDHLSGWKILRSDGKYVKIFLQTTQRFRNGAIRQAWYTVNMDKEQKKQKYLSLASILYAWFIGDVPAGMVVDHIDNNNMNESLDNYQLLTRGENVKKDHSGHNQYTDPDKLIYKL